MELFHTSVTFLRTHLHVPSNFEVFAHHIYFQPKRRQFQEDELYRLLLNQVQCTFLCQKEVFLASLQSIYLVFTWSVTKPEIPLA